MILIADSGSTKTDWCVVEHGQLIQQIFTKGKIGRASCRERV